MSRRDLNPNLIFGTTAAKSLLKRSKAVSYLQVAPSEAVVSRQPLDPDPAEAAVRPENRSPGFIFRFIDFFLQLS